MRIPNPGMPEGILGPNPDTNGNPGQIGTNRDMRPANNASGTNRRLDTWKEIGAFFGRDERTVKRWETTRGLPVRRVPGAGRANVYANTDELVEWLKGSDPGTEQASEAFPSVETGPEVEADAAYADAGSVDRRQGDRRSGERMWRWPLVWGRWLEAKYIIAALAVLILALSVVVVARHISSVRAAHADAIATRHHTVDHQAEQFYLQGLYYWHKRTPEALHEAVDYFTQAVVRDPQYAEAYVGLADCYNLLREYSLMAPEEAYPRAMSAAQRAIALNDSLSGAHSSLGFVDFYWSWDVAGAQREFARALVLDPNSVIAHHWYATFLLHLARFPESLEEIEKAQKLDPNSTAILADKGLILFYHGERGQAVALLKQLEASEPDFLSPHNYLAFMYLVQGNYAQYLAEDGKGARLLRDEPRLNLVKAGEQGFAQGGSRGMLDAMLKTQQALHITGQESAYNLGRTYALLGRKQDALDELQSAAVRREADILRLRIDPTLSSLHGEPRFREILAQVGLPPLQ
jgi:tetratricopeptide (TPR) repeat protein